MIQAEVKSHRNHSENAPSVSVVIPAYNAAKCIGEALTSVFDQTFASFEVLIINDGSPDTADLERELQPYADVIQYIKQENRGAAAARNTGLRAATGEFIAFLDADDKWAPNFLEKQIELLKESDADLVFSDAVFFGESPLAGRTFMELQPSHGDVTPEKLLAVEVTVLTSTVLVRKAPVMEVGLFDESIRRGHDFDLWLRLAKHGMRFAYQREILAYYRISESGLSGGTISQLERTLDVIEILKAQAGLTASEEAALQVNLKRTLRQLALEKGKEKLLDRDFSGALDAFNDAKQFGQDWKLIVVSLGLRIAPDVLWRIYNRREVTPRRATSA